jgi:hypothetical protein
LKKILLEYDRISGGEGSNLIIAGARVPAAGAFVAPIIKPQIFKTCLTALGKVVREDFISMDYDEWLDMVIDPVVGIHPDGISFEGFSRDGSILGWVHFDMSVFGKPEIHKAGCTSIDYSEKLQSFLHNLTSLSKINLSIGTQEGVTLVEGPVTHREKRISLPDNWIRGFGEIHAGLAQSEISIPLNKADLMNIIRAAKKRIPPNVKGRALIFELNPGEKAKVIVQPWNTAIRLNAAPSNIYEAMEIKVYGRKRLEILEAIIPQIKNATLHLLGDSRPSYWEFNFSGARFIVALSSWTSQKFTESYIESMRVATYLDDPETIRKAAEYLSDMEFLSGKELADELKIQEEEVMGVIMALCRQGLATIEPSSGNIRWRPISHFPFYELSAKGELSSRERNAEKLISEDKLKLLNVINREGLIITDGICEGRTGEYKLSASLNPDYTFASARCDCAWMRRQKNDLRVGPCKHLLALREEAIKQMRSTIND